MRECGLLRWLIPVVLICGGAGCGSETPGPGAGTSNTIGAASVTPGTSGKDAETGIGNQMAPEGNQEPPVDAQDVALKVVTPDEFNSVVAAHRGKVVLVDFWALWCGACVKAFPHTVELSKKHANDGLVVISMSFDDPAEKEAALAFLKEHNAEFENLMCSLGGSTESFNAYENETEALPYFRLYDREGKLAKVFKVDVDAGKGIDPADIDKALEELLGSPAAAVSDEQKPVEQPSKEPESAK